MVPPVTTITSRRHPMVDGFRELAESPDPEGRRLLLDGAHLVEAAQAAGCELEVVAMASGTPDIAERLRRSGVEVIAVNDDVLRAISPVKTPSGVVAVVRRQPASLGSMSQRADALIVVAVDVQDPGNLGSLMRAAEAGGATGIVVAGNSAHPFGWKTLRGSMGSALRLPVVQLPLEGALSAMRTAGVATVAAVPLNGTPLDQFNWTGRLAILLGGEGAGLPHAVVAASDHRVSIPMAEPVDSLNVAVAGALLVYAARRMRT